MHPKYIRMEKYCLEGQNFERVKLYIKKYSKAIVVSGRGGL
jgi:hypothetical protein